jgi:Uma2 family endonuclease
MVMTTKKYTAADLWRMPADAPYELWHGVLVDVLPTGLESSATGVWLVVRVSVFVESHDLGVVTGADGGYLLLSDEGRETVVAPDVGFVRWERLPGRKLTPRHCPVPPDLALEVQSPSDTPCDMQKKLGLYMEAGVPLVWWVDLGQRVVRGHRSGRPSVVLRAGDVLDGEDILPGFRLPVADIFDRV